MRRRTLLASAVIPTTVGATGCLSSRRDETSASVRLGWFGIHNVDPESAHTFELAVERDGETVHQSTHEIPAADDSGSGVRSDGAVADCDWGRTAGDYTVRVRMDETAEAEESVTAFANETDADCVVADAEYRNHDAVSRYIDAKTLSIRQRDDCDNDGYERRCSFTEE